MKVVPHRLARIFALVLLSPIPNALRAAPEPWLDNGVVWGGPDQSVSGYYRPGSNNGGPDGIYDDALPPAADPTWMVGIPGGSPEVSLVVPETAGAGYLHISTTAASGIAYTLGTWNGNPTWTSPNAATLEFTVRVNSVAAGAQWAGTVQAGNISEFLAVGLGVDEGGFLTIWNLAEDFAVATSLLASEFNTIRITMSGLDSSETSTASVYLNNSPEPFDVYTTFMTGEWRNVRFGEWHTAPNLGGGDVDWQSFKWISGTAIAPVPEPATVGLLAAGFLILVIARAGRPPF